MFRRSSFPLFAEPVGRMVPSGLRYRRAGFGTIIPKYVHVSSDDEVRGTIADIEQFLKQYGHDDASLSEAVERVFHPAIIMEGWEEMTTREWLLRVAELLQVVPRSGLVREERACDKDA